MSEEEKKDRRRARYWAKFALRNVADAIRHQRMSDSNLTGHSLFWHDQADADVTNAYRNAKFAAHWARCAAEARDQLSDLASLVSQKWALGEKERAEVLNYLVGPRGCMDFDVLPYRVRAAILDAEDE
jgi:hypothetical protein